MKKKLMCSLWLFLTLLCFPQLTLSATIEPCPKGQARDEIGICVECEEIGRTWDETSSSCVCGRCRREVSGQCKWCYEDRMECDPSGKCLQTTSAGVPEDKIVDSEPEKCPRGQVREGLRCVSCEQHGKVWDEAKGSCICEPCTREFNGKCRWCYEDDMACGDGGQCLPTVISSDPKPPDTGGDTREPGPGLGSDGRIMIDDFSKIWDQQKDQVIDDRRISDGLIIRELVPVIDTILVPVVIDKGGHSSTSSHSSSSSVIPGSDQLSRQRAKIDSDLANTKRNMKTVNRYNNNNRLDIKMLDKQINILKNKPYLTPSQKAFLDKLSKIKKEREDCQKDLAEKKKRVRSDDRKLTANKREIEQSGKQNRFNEECQHKRKQDVFNRDAEHRRKQEKFNEQVEHKRKQEEMNQRKERDLFERDENKRKQEEMNRIKKEESQRRPSPEPSPTPSQSDCVDGVRVNSPSWTRLNQTQKNEMLRRKASFDAWNRDHPGQFKSYPSQMLEMFCQ